MNLLISILFWVGIVFLVDGSCGLLLQEKWKKMAAGLNIQRIALIEIGVAFALLAGHYSLRCWGAG
ncbi:hypothetical protein [Pontiella sulfatireligans]|uniref:Uncharacterized protein n=1 Tax=Pontiella sulfatireligans TaxID=2750658 RepID=A0A6C2UJE6_9BACT|nr:hypothetical protein [Pontiella sulfatireligans]VGO20345.1 hypothetical protein SCARR_02408 [Pontiella sulfatireligans]